MLGGGIAAAGYGHEFGPFGGIVGFLLGAAAAFSLVLAWAFFTGLAWGGIPPTPVCRNGTCTVARGDYDLARRLPNGEYVSRCRCGRTYQRRGRLLMADMLRMLPQLHPSLPDLLPRA